ncbi:MAG TPA: PadR family transcriptional regulator [Longimicrobiales bacterium]|nr:PadR family transcriptional regulator [Longimicrobiales bacterium]
MSEAIDVVSGTLELLVLKTLSRGEALHGFEILRWLRDTTGGALVIEEGALYPALHRMERRGWLQAEWGVSEKGRRAKYYGITAEGRAGLAREEGRWTRYVRAWDQIARAVES